MNTIRATKRFLAAGAIVGALLALGPGAVTAQPQSGLDAYEVEQILRYARPSKLFLRSSVALVMDQREGAILYGRDIDVPRPIASLTKLMTSLVTLQAGLPLDEPVTITRADRDRLRGTKSRLRYGTVLSRHDLLHAALGASDNRAAAALGRTYPGGKQAAVQAMNLKAEQLGMTETQFRDTSGLHSGNVSTARDLAKLVAEMEKHPLFRTLSTTGRFSVTDRRSGKKIPFLNTNRLVRRDAWDIGLSKTGYTADAGNCLVMQTKIAERPLIIVLLNSWGKLSKFGDSNRIRKWLLNIERRVLSSRAAVPGRI